MVKEVISHIAVIAIVIAFGCGVYTVNMNERKHKVEAPPVHVYKGEVIEIEAEGECHQYVKHLNTGIAHLPNCKYCRQ